MTTFVDQVLVHAAAGDGGNGCASIHREKFKPLGGPDGGNGGRGGDVILEVDTDVTTLLDFHFHPHHKATGGKPGQGGNRYGAEGKDLILKVPNGTVVRAVEGEQLVDMVGQGTKYVLCKGGNGGLGNAALASSRRKAPGFALLGEPGDATDVILELKTVADVALVGYPSAGKSSLIAVISAAKPKIADYPFTTLVPNLGMVSSGDHVITVADVPGLIPGASQGKGLGHEFLRHVERCSVIVHVIDCATLEPDRDPLHDLDVIEAELASYDEQLGTDLMKRPRLVALNKIDLPDARTMVELVTEALEARNLRAFPISTASHEGLRPLILAMGELVAAERASRPVEQATRIVLRPAPVGGAEFQIQMVEDVYVISGVKPERWVRQTQWDNDEAVGYLADRLATIGVEAQLMKMGATAGAVVQIGEAVFDWEPTIMPGVGGSTAGPRGTDERLDDSNRLRTDDRRAKNSLNRPGDDRYVSAWDIDEDGLVEDAPEVEKAESEDGGDGVEVVWMKP